MAEICFRVSSSISASFLGWVRPPPRPPSSEKRAGVLSGTGGAGSEEIAARKRVLLGSVSALCSCSILKVKQEAHSSRKEQHKEYSNMEYFEETANGKNWRNPAKKLLASIYTVPQKDGTGTRVPTKKYRYLFYN
jgi:hypothetical protein